MGFEMIQVRTASILILILLLSGCSLQTSQIPATALPGTTTTDLPESQTSTLTPVATTLPGSPIRLSLWLPPFLNPGTDTPASDLLRKRLEEFQARNPNVIIETRVKAVHGPGGLLNSLTTASAAAPATLPDLVALPHDLEEAAALKGLLLPLDDLTDSINDPDWYPFALELAHLQNNIYGLPFAGDALVQVYHTDPITSSLKSWNSLLQRQASLIFPAASSAGFFYFG